MKKKLEYIIKYAESKSIDIHNLLKYTKKGWTLKKIVEDLLWGNEYYRLLFSHDFSKAVYTEKWICSDCGKPLKTKKCGTKKMIGHAYSVISWQYHLQNCVISDDPISYYYDYIKGL